MGMRGNQVQLGLLRDVRRGGGSFPASHASVAQREGEEDVGVAKHVMVEEVAGSRAEVRYVERPSRNRDCEPKLVLLIAFAMERDKALTIGSILALATAVHRAFDR